MIHFSRGLAGAAVLCGVMMAQPARALTVSGFAGSYLQSGETGMFGGEVSLTLIPELDLGVFYEYSQSNFGSDASPSGSNRHFYGAVGRFRLPLLSFFADLRLGPHHTSDFFGYTLNGAYGEGGLGYDFNLGVAGLKIQPRLGFLVFETSGQYPWVNASLMVSASL